MNSTQIRLTISDTLHEHLSQKAKQYGLTMAGYVKNLIIQDLKETQRPMYQAPLPIDESVKKKKRFNWGGLDPLDG